MSRFSSWSSIGKALLNLATSRWPVSFFLSKWKVLSHGDILIFYDRRCFRRWSRTDTRELPIVVSRGVFEIAKSKLSLFSRCAEAAVGAELRWWLPLRSITPLIIFKSYVIQRWPLPVTDDQPWRESAVSVHYTHVECNFFCYLVISLTLSGVSLTERPKSSSSSTIITRDVSFQRIVNPLDHALAQCGRWKKRYLFIEVLDKSMNFSTL